MKHFLASLSQGFFNVLFPKACFFCQKEGLFLCQDCQASFEILEQNFCLCQKPKMLLSPGKCKNCQSKNLQGLYFPLFYENPRVRHLIQAFKYEPCLRDLAKPLSSFIITYFLLRKKRGFPHFVLIPVPLEKRRLRRRGFNQAQELGKYLAAHFEIPLISDCLLKIKKTPAQTDLSEKQRKENIRGAFLVKNKEKIKGKKIFLIDDVYTTGATMEEATRVLKKAGTKEVWGLVVARSAKV